MSLTLAIARDVPVGVVIAAWSGRLSRMYHWDVERDAFTPGQFVKAHASVLAISPNGKYVVYYAEALSKKEQAYVAISHVPYFTAHAFFKQFHCGGRSARFASNDRLELHTMTTDYSHVQGYDEIRERIEPGCPFHIDTSAPSQRSDMTFVVDDARDRRVVEEGLELAEYKPPGENRRIIATFPREEFMAVVPPDWATSW